MWNVMGLGFEYAFKRNDLNTFNNETTFNLMYVS